MIINELMEKKGITKYRLSKESGVPYTTVNDICSGKAQLEKCAVETLYRIASVLEVSVDDIISPLFEKDTKDSRKDFDTFRREEIERLRKTGEKRYILLVTRSTRIEDYFEKEWYREAMYVLGLTDYLCRKNSVRIYPKYEDIREYRLRNYLFPKTVFNDDNPREMLRLQQKMLKKAIPELLRHRIVETEDELRNM